jgi:hypothetical protein
LPAAASAVTTGFLRDLIVAGHLPPELSYLASDPSKLVRARKVAMGGAKDKDRENQKQIVGLGYDGRQGPSHPCHGGRLSWQEEDEDDHRGALICHEEPSGKYLGHFVPEPPGGPEPSALKGAQGLLTLLEQNSSTNSLMFGAGDSTNINTGWKGGTHALSLGARSRSSSPRQFWPR